MFWFWVLSLPLAVLTDSCLNYQVKSRQLHCHFFMFSWFFGRIRRWGEFSFNSLLLLLAIFYGVFNPLCLISGWLGFEKFVSEIRTKFRIRLLFLCKFRTSLCTQIWIGSVWHQLIRTLDPSWIHRTVNFQVSIDLPAMSISSYAEVDYACSWNEVFSGSPSTMFSTQAHTGYSRTSYSRALCQKLNFLSIQQTVLACPLEFRSRFWWSLFGPCPKLERSSRWFSKFNLTWGYLNFDTSILMIESRTRRTKTKMRWHRPKSIYSLVVSW